MLRKVESSSDNALAQGRRQSPLPEATTRPSYRRGNRSTIGFDRLDGLVWFKAQKARSKKRCQRYSLVIVAGPCGKLRKTIWFICDISCRMAKLKLFPYDNVGDAISITAVSGELTRHRWAKRYRIHNHLRQRSIRYLPFEQEKFKCWHFYSMCGRYTRENI